MPAGCQRCGIYIALRTCQPALHFLRFGFDDGRCLPYLDCHDTRMPFEDQDRILRRVCSNNQSIINL